jgi:hypothetical protein
MNKEFAPYEQALELKQLGFDEPCLGYYIDNKFEFFADVRSCNTNSEFGFYPTAPTYQQAFRFFREKYNLDSFVKHLYKSTIKVGYYFGIDEYKGIQFQIGLDAWYNTYEEAELACLIKLIEIVKNK